MSTNKRYLKIEKKIYHSLGRIGYTICFLALGILIMSILDLFLYIFVDNFYLTKFVFTQEINISEWWEVLINTYKYSYMKMIFFGIILLATGIYRASVLKNIFKE